jgi:hypothetical protein
MTRYQLEDDLDEDLDDEDEDQDDEDEEDEDEEDDEDVETWQVRGSERLALKRSRRLTSAGELPRLTPIFQLS